jgi:hypothetical protein
MERTWKTDPKRTWVEKPDGQQEKLITNSQTSKKCEIMCTKRLSWWEAQALPCAAETNLGGREVGREEADSPMPVKHEDCKNVTGATEGLEEPEATTTNQATRVWTVPDTVYGRDSVLRTSDDDDRLM